MDTSFFSIFLVKSEKVKSNKKILNIHIFLYKKYNIFLFALNPLIFYFEFDIISTNSNIISAVKGTWRFL